MNYDYTAAKADCATKGLVWSDALVAAADAEFAHMSLSQAQVTRLVQMNLHYVAWAFTPKTYTLGQRLALAWHFLFGKGPL